MFPLLMNRSRPLGALRMIVIAVALLFGSIGAANAALTGTLNIPGDYATLEAAVAELNAQGVGSGGVTLNLVAGNAQTAPAGGYVIGGTGSLVLTTTSSGNPVVIQGNGNTITAPTPQTSANLNDAIFKLIGADWITITGFVMQENAANTTTTPASNNMTEWGVALLHVSTTDGCQNNAIQGNTISLNRSYTNTWGVYANNRHSATAPTVTEDVTNNTTGPQNGNKVYGNTISNVNMGVAFIGTSTAANQDAGNDVGGASSGNGNNISNWGGAAAASSYISNSGTSYCIFMNHQVGDNVSWNTLTSAAVSGTSVTFRGIFKDYTVTAPTGTFTTNITNNTVTMTSGFTSGTFEAIRSQGMTALATATININYNTILNCAVTGTSSSTGIVGIINSSVPGALSISNNVIRGTTSTATTGGFIGVQNAGAVVNSITLSNNQIGNASGGAITFSAATSGAVYGVYNTAGAGTAALVVQNNDIRGIVHSVAGTSGHNYIYNSAATLSQNISNNTFTNLNVNTTGTAYFIYNSVSAPTGGSKTINGNSIVTGYNKAGAGGTVYCYYDNASSVTGVVVNSNNNNFSNITLTGATTMAGWQNTDGGSPTKTISGNTFSNWTCGTSAVTVMNLNYGASSTVTSNTITNIAGGGAVTGIVLGSSLTTVTASQNTLGTLSSTGASAVQGITCATATANLLKNRIYDLSGSNASTTVNGLLVSAGTTVTVANNLIGDLRATAATSTSDVVRGISLTSTSTASNLYLYYNTIYLNASSSGTNFSTSGIYHTTSTTATTAALTLRDNIIVNLSTPSGTGIAAAYRRSSTTLTNYASASNTNLFYGGAPAANRVIFYDGTNADQTLAAFQARVSPREANSITENPPFLSTSGSSPSFLHINPVVPTQLESAGQAVAGITDDYDGEARNATTPDIGADEGGFTGADLTGPAIAFTPLGNTAYTGDRTLTATITDPSGVPTSGTGLPVLYWKINSGAWQAATSTWLSGNDYQFTFGTGAVYPDVVSYYICAQDNASTPNVSCSPAGGAGGLTANPPAAATPPTTPWSYSLVASIAGTFTVGATGNYATLTAAAADLNAKFMTGAVVFELIDAAYPSETFPIVVNANAGASATNTLTIRPAGGNAAAIGGSLASGALIKLNGADYVTIDGSNSGGTDRSLTLTNTATTAPCAVWIASLGNGAGATWVTVKNCNLNVNAATSATAFAVAVTGSTLPSQGGDNDNVTIRNNAVSSSNTGVYAFGGAAGSAGGMDNLVVAGNSFATSSTLSPVYGVEVAYALNALIDGNTFNLMTSAGTAPVAISVETGVSGSSVTNNQIQSVVATATAGYGGRGITVGTAATGSNITVANNFIAGVNGSNFTTFGNSSSMGIALGVIGNSTTLTTTTGGVKLYHNSVNLYGTYSYSGSCVTAGLYVGSGASALDIRNNIISNTLSNSHASGTGSKNYAVYSAAANIAYAPISYNDYYVSGTQGVLGYLGGDQATLSAFQTAFTGSASTPGYSVQPMYAANTDLHIPPATISMLESGGAGGTGIVTDIDNQARPGPPGSVNGGGTAPDVGADEFDGTPVPGNDIAATAFVDPANGGTKSTGIPFAPQASFTNAGLNAQTDVTVRYRIIGPAPSTTEVYNQTAVIASIASMAFVTVTFPNATLPSGGTYEIHAAAELAGDQAPGNDQITGSITGLEPLAGVYTVGLGAFRRASGLDLSFERRVDAVRLEVREPVETDPKSGNADGTALWRTVEREVEVTSWLPAVGGRPYSAPLRIGPADVPNFPNELRDGAYPTLTAAIADLNLRGVSGPVTFLLTDATYPTESFPITIQPVLGASAGNTITIRPDTGVTSTISGSMASGALIKLNGADYVTIDGSNSGGTDRSLTLTNTATTAPCVVWLASQGAGAGAAWNTVKNCILNATAATTSSYAIAVSDGTIASQGGDNDNVTIQNNAIASANYGVYAFGNAVVSAGGMDNLTVTGNAFTANGTSSPTYGVEVGNALNATIGRNTFNLTTSASTSPVAISIETGVSNSSVTDNKTIAVVTTATGGYGGRGITVGTGATNSNIRIVNNFIAGVNGSNYSSFGNSSAMGIALGVIGNSTSLTTTVGGVYLYHNSVNLAGTYSYAASCVTAGLYVGSGASALDIRNNIIVNTLANTNASGTGSKNYAVYSAAANTAFAPISWNDYYVSGTQGVLGYLGGDQATLGAFNTAFTGSPSTPGYNVNPAYTSATDLHIPEATASLLESGAFNGLDVTVDIDDQTRPGPPGSIHGGGTAPDVGADEFDGTPVFSDDMAATAFVDPVNGGTKSAGAAFAPQASFTNTGLNPQSNVTVRYRIVGPAPSTDEVYNQTAVIASIASFAVVTVTFPSTTLSASGSYTIYAAAELAGDQVPANNQITGSFNILAPLAGTYYVGLGAFREASGLDLTFEKRVETVRRQVLVPAETARRSPEAQSETAMAWQTVEQDVEAVSWVPVADGRQLAQPLRVSRAENPALPEGLRDGVYATITAAVADLNARGVSGPVTFLLTDAAYPAETFPILIHVTAGAPTAANPVVFKPNTGVIATVSGASPSSAVFKVLNSYITIDGSNTVNGTTRDLTLENTSTTGPLVVWFGSTGTTPITNATVKNCVIRDGVSSGNAVMISDGSSSGSAGYFSDLSILNNRIEKALNGVYANGGTTPANGSGLVLRNNELNSSGANAIRKTGLYLQGVTGADVSNNEIGNFEQTTSENDLGIWIAAGATNVTVNANRIHDLNYTATSGYGPKGIAISTATASSNVTVSNNMIFNLTGDGDSYATYGCTYNPAGIFVYSSATAGVSVYGNSIYLYGNTLNFSAGAYSVGIGLDDGASADVSGNNVVNNLGRLSTVGAGATAIALETAATQLTGGDYNNLYCNSTGGGVNLVGKIATTDYATMADWRTASGRDAHSVTADPLYVGNTDLHIRQDVISPVGNAGAPLAGLTHDYDGDVRNAATPDIGADEFTIFILTTHVVGTGSIQVAPLQAAYAPGTPVTLTAVPADACHPFTVWSGDAGGNTNPLNLIMNSNLDITATFTEVAPPAAAVVSPNGGEMLSIGAQATITWTASSSVEVTAVDLHYSTDAGATWHSIASGLPNTGTYGWVVPDAPTTQGRVQVTAHDACGQSTSDMSDGNFTITNVDAVWDNLLPAGEVLGLYPNPAAPGDARILYRLPAGSMTLDIYDLSGRLVRRLDSGDFRGGVQALRWDGRDSNGQTVATGIYLVRAHSASGTGATKRLILFQQ